MPEYLSIIPVWRRHESRQHHNKHLSETDRQIMDQGIYNKSSKLISLVFLVKISGSIVEMDRLATIVQMNFFSNFQVLSLWFSVLGQSPTKIFPIPIGRGTVQWRSDGAQNKVRQRVCFNGFCRNQEGWNSKNKTLLLWSDDQLAKGLTRKCSLTHPRDLSQASWFICSREFNLIPTQFL